MDEVCRLATQTHTRTDIEREREREREKARERKTSFGTLKELHTEALDSCATLSDSSMRRIIDDDADP